MTGVQTCALPILDHAFCFLLAVPGDIALSVLGAVIAKRVRPVVLQYLFDSKSNVRLEREELVK